MGINNQYTQNGVKADTRRVYSRNKSGSSLAVGIPREIVELYRLKAKDELVFTAVGSNTFEVSIERRR